MSRFIGITGTPGTGKKTIAPLVAAKMSMPCYSLNDLALPSNLPDLSSEDYEVDTAALKKKIARLPPGPAVLYGHLLPYVIKPKDLKLAVVLRCEPSVLRERLERRDYSREKVTENVEAELIGVVSALAVKSFGRAKVFEFDATNASPESAANHVARIAAGNGPRKSPVDWTLLYDSASKLRSLSELPTVGSART